MGRFNWWMLAVAIVAVVASDGVQAAVICARLRPDGTISGSAKIRQACRPSETALSAESLGLQGPVGSTGATGPAGPPGPTGPQGPSPGFSCTSSCVSGYPSVNFECGGESSSCSSGFQTAHARVVSCRTDDTLATPFCLAATCGSGPCPGEASTPSCDPAEAIWAVTAEIGGRVCGIGTGTLTCQFALAEPRCTLGSQDYLITVQEGVTPRLVWSSPCAPNSCTPLLLRTPAGGWTDSADIQVADTRYYSTGTFDGGTFQCGGCSSSVGGGSSFCGISGSFRAVGSCP